MFTVSAKGVYGLTAMLELAKSYSRGSMQIKDIAEAHDIPQHYLEQILVALKKAGLVESFRGSRGGYSLARPPSQIALIDILTHLEGKLSVIPDQHKTNPLAFFWLELEKRIAGTLERTLEDVLHEQQRRQNQIFYSI